MSADNSWQLIWVQAWMGECKQINFEGFPVISGSPFKVPRRRGACGRVQIPTSTEMALLGPPYYVGHSCETATNPSDAVPSNPPPSAGRRTPGPTGSVLPRLSPCHEPQGMAMMEPDNKGAVPELRVLERQRAGFLGQMHRAGTGFGSGLSRSGCQPPAPKAAWGCWEMEKRMYISFIFK